MSTAAADPVPPVPELSDGVITLREPLTKDVEGLVAHCRDPEMVRWTRVPVPYQRSDAEAWLADGWSGWSRGRYQFVIECEGRLAGTLALRPDPAARVTAHPTTGGAAEVGYGLAPEFRGRGVMARALRLLLTWGFTEAGLEVVHWRAVVGNWPSRRAAWAVGFQVVGAVPGLLDERDGRRVDGWVGALRRDQALSPAHPWLVPVPLTGRGLELRPLQDDDVPRFVEAHGDPDNRRYLPGLPGAYRTADAEEHLLAARTMQASGQAAFWALTTREDPRLLGEVLVNIRNPREKVGEIGYWSHPQARGHGLTTEAVRLVSRHSLLPTEDGGLGLDSVLLRIEEGNAASRRVAEKAGFTLTGRDRGQRAVAGGRTDIVRYDLLPDELPPVR